MDLKNAANMAQFNRERNKQIVFERAAKALGCFAMGELISTKQLEEAGYGKNAITRLVKNGGIRRVKRGVYEVISLDEE